MKVWEIMTKKPIKISRSTSIQEAALKMKELDCGFLPVGSDDTLEGVITDRDIVLRAVANGQSPQAVTVGDILTNKVMYCLASDDILTAAKRMKKAQVYRLVVVNNDKEKWMQGIITLGDISRHTHDEKLVGETAERITEAA